MYLLFKLLDCSHTIRFLLGKNQDLPHSEISFVQASVVFSSKRFFQTNLGKVCESNRDSYIGSNYQIQMTKTLFVEKCSLPTTYYFNDTVRQVTCLPTLILEKVYVSDNISLD